LRLDAGWTDKRAQNLGKRDQIPEQLTLFKFQAHIALMVAILLSLRADAGTQTFASFMDDGRSDDVVQNFARAEIAYSQAYYLAQKSNNQNDLFYSLAHLLCTRVVLRKYTQADQLFSTFLALGEDLKKHGKLDGDMVEEIDDICDAYEAGDRLAALYSSGIDTTRLLRFERSLQLRLEFLPTAKDDLDANVHTLFSLYFKEHNYTKAQKLIQMAMGTSTKKSPETVAKYNLMLSFIYEKIGPAGKSKTLRDSAQQSFARLHSLATYYSEVARLYSVSADWQQAVNYSSLAIKQYEKPMQPQLLAETLIKRAQWLLFLDKNSESEKDFRRALLLSKKFPECWRSLPQSYHGLACVMERNHNAQQAAQYFALEKSATKGVRNMERKDFSDISGNGL